MCDECTKIQEQQKQEWENFLKEKITFSPLGKMCMEMPVFAMAEVIVAFHEQIKNNAEPDTGEWSDNQCSLLGQLNEIIQASSKNKLKDFQPEAVVLNYVCPDCNDESTQFVCDLVQNGTLTCDCGTDCEINKVTVLQS